MKKVSKKKTVKVRNIQLTPKMSQDVLTALYDLAQIVRNIPFVSCKHVEKFDALAEAFDSAEGIADESVIPAPEKKRKPVISFLD